MYLAHKGSTRVMADTTNAQTKSALSNPTYGL